MVGGIKFESLRFFGLLGDRLIAGIVGDWDMSNDGQRRQGGNSNPRSSSSSSSSPSSTGRSNGFLPSSLRAISSYLKIVSSGASTVASTVRSASANVASSVSDRERDSKRDQVFIF